VHITTRKRLLDTISDLTLRRRAFLLDLVEEVLDSVSPEKLLQPHLKSIAVEGFERFALFAVGKAARAMSEAALNLLPRKPDLIFLADEGHPLPTEAGLAKTAALMRGAESLGERDAALVLISGGGSAMLTSPAEGLTLSDLVETNTLLLASGATINEINCVRKHLSRVKGGRLAELIAPAQTTGLVISDVVGNDLSSIASGPLSPDPTTFEQALAIVERYGLKVPTAVRQYLERGHHGAEEETPKPGSDIFAKTKLTIVADHNTVVQKTLEAARRRGVSAIVQDSPISGEARQAGAQFAAAAAPGSLTVAAGETTVTCTGSGKGGRNQEFVLGGLDALPEDATLLSLGTDGIDGVCPKETAGALIDKELASTGPSPTPYLNNNDSYHYFQKVGGLIITGPTGNNLGDLALILRD